MEHLFRYFLIGYARMCDYMDPISPQSLGTLLADLRARRPLVHHITNAVTMNDCANVTLAIGAAPVMAEAMEEIGEMVGLADALVLNIGTLSRQQILSMTEAGHCANRKGIPVILDPVGAGATSLRTASALMLLEELKISVLKGNAGEIGVLAGADAQVRGVDSWGVSGDIVTIAKSLAKERRIVVAVSGVVDVITDGARTVYVSNGHEMLGRLSGTGCMVASLTGAFSAVSKDHMAAAAGAFTAFGIAGEQAASAGNGPYAFRTALVDRIAALSSEDIAGQAQIRTG